MKKLLFIFNPISGTAALRGRIMPVIDIFTKAGYLVTTYPTQCKGDATRAVMEMGSGYDLVVCAGGDGTLDETVSGCLTGNLNVPLGYIPCGTTNDFARSLNIPFDPEEAARAIVNGKPINLDIGKFLDRYYIYIASFGAFTEISYSTPQKNKNLLGHTAYVLEGIKSLPTIQSYETDITFDGKTITGGSYIFAMVTNSLSVGGFTALSDKDMAFNDGIFEALLIRTPQSPMDLQSIVNALLLNDLDNEFMVHFKASKITFTSKDPIPWALDGEDGGSHREVTIQNLHQVQQLICQPSAANILNNPEM